MLQLSRWYKRDVYFARRPQWSMAEKGERGRKCYDCFHQIDILSMRLARCMHTVNIGILSVCVYVFVCVWVIVSSQQPSFAIPTAVSARASFMFASIHSCLHLVLPQIQGAVMVASLFQVVLGFSGIMTIFLRLISPLVVIPTITLVGLPLFEAAVGKSSKQWWIALLWAWCRSFWLYCRALITREEQSRKNMKWGRVVGRWDGKEINVEANWLRRKLVSQL